MRRIWARKRERKVESNVIVRFVKSKRLAWLEHVKSKYQKIVTLEVDRRKRSGRPRNVDENKRNMHTGKWWEKIQCREE